MGDGLIRLETDYGLGVARTRGAQIRDGQAITVAVRRESVNLVMQETPDNLGLRAVVREKHYAGGVLQIIVSLSDGRELVCSRQGIDSPLKPGDHVLVTWLPDQGVIVDMEAAG